MEQKPPLVVKIFSWILLIVGIFDLLGFLPVLILGGLAKVGFLMVLAVINLFTGAGYIATSFGLRKMKRWSLYVLTVITFLAAGITIYNFVTSGTTEISEIIALAIQVVLVGYLWTIQHKFK